MIMIIAVVLVSSLIIKYLLHLKNSNHYLSLLIVLNRPKILQIWHFSI